LYFNIGETLPSPCFSDAFKPNERSNDPHCDGETEEAWTNH